jgi:hypothetical protein
MSKTLEPRLGEWLQSITGRQLFFDALPQDIELEDIAHHLSLMNRFVCATRVPYSVAQHSLYVSDHLPPHLQAWGLLHDAHEHIIGDLSRPLVKHLARVCPGFEKALLKLKTSIDVAIAQRFGIPALTEQDKALVHRIDDTLLATELRDVMGGQRQHAWERLPPALEWRIEPRGWRLVRGIFVDRAKELGIITKEECKATQERWKNETISPTEAPEDPPPQQRAVPRDP